MNTKNNSQNGEDHFRGLEDPKLTQDHGILPKVQYLKGEACECYYLTPVHLHLYTCSREQHHRHQLNKTTVLN